MHLLLLLVFLVSVKECRNAGPGGKAAVQSKNSKIFYFGADLSYVNQILDHGGEYKDEGLVSSPYKIFKNHGTNLVRVRLWHTPVWTKEVYGTEGKQMYSNIDDVEKTIRLSKELGMEVELDFHYSDTWADPGKQEAPAAWKEIKDPKVLTDSIYQYTYKTLQNLNNKGLMPEWVQVGNEINCGLFYTKAPADFPFANACKGNWKRLGEYLNAGIKAIRDAGAASSIKPRILLHVADPKHVQRWFDSIITTGKVFDFDAIGFSYYPLWHTSIAVDSISNHISKWKSLYNKDVMILETAYPWTTEPYDNYRNAFGSQKPLENFPFTKEGQSAFLKALTHEVKDGGAIGLIYWEPAWISSAMKDLWGTGSSWENAGLFDFTGNTLPAIDFMKSAVNKNN